MAKRVGRVTYENRFVIISVPDDWKPEHGLPPANADDEWFESLAEFRGALNGPFDRQKINRVPCDATGQAKNRVSDTRRSGGEIG